MRGVLVTGTDTGVGKTWVSAGILRAARNSFASPAYWKPVQTGDDDDTDKVAELTGLRTLSPLYRFSQGLSPYLAAKREGKDISKERLTETLLGHATTTDFLIVEGAGGWLAPFGPSLLFADLAQEWKLPVVLVVKDRLGAINHTLLTLEAIAARGLEVAGIVLSQRNDRVGNFETLSKMRPDIALLDIPEVGLEEWPATSARVSWHRLFS